MKKKSMCLLTLLFLLTSSTPILVTKSQTQLYLDLETDPLYVLTVDPDALTGEGYYDSGDNVTIYAKPTVIDEASMTRFDFIEWVGADYVEPEGNTAYVFMDGDRTATARYGVSFYLSLITDPPEVLTIDPDALTGEGWHGSGANVTIYAKQTITSGPIRYEFVEWVGYDYVEPEGNTAYKFMDGAHTVTAVYEEIVEVEWKVKLSGELDYLERENVKVRLAALVTSADTGEPVSGADVNLDIYDEEGGHLVSAPMIEKLAGTGIYEWKSPKTIRSLMLANKIKKGVYLVHVQASNNGQPIASDILEFHIDPPGEDFMSLTTIAIAVIALLASIITPLILVKQGTIRISWKSGS
jgi:hypothetical protein